MSNFSNTTRMKLAPIEKGLVLESQVEGKLSNGRKVIVSALGWLSESLHKIAHGM
jgi:hypothetical protein